MATIYQPRWQDVLEKLAAELQSGAFEPGSSYHKISDVCARFEISNITGRRVFKELKDRGYIVTRGRRGSFVTHTQREATVFMCMRDEFFEASHQTTSSFQFLHDFAMGFTESDAAPLFDLKPIRSSFVLEHVDRFDGKPLIVSADVVLRIHDADVRIDHHLLRDLNEKLQPIFFHAYAGLEGVIQVGSDLRRATFQPTEHLIRRGHTRLGLLCGETTSPWFRPRLQGYLDALHEGGLSFAPELVRVTSGKNAAEDHAAVADLLALPDPPTALVGANDGRALHALTYCYQHGIQVPGELAVTGADNHPEAQLSRPPLTTCDGRNREQGKEVADLLMRRLQGERLAPQTIRLDPAFILRESS